MKLRGPRKATAVAASGCLLLLLLCLVGATVPAAKAQPNAAIDHLTDILAAKHLSCGDGDYWSIPPKGQSTLNCDRFEIDVFNNSAEVHTFLRWKKKSQDVGFLKRFQLDSFVLRGPTWVLLTPSEPIAAALRAGAGGSLITIAR
jgi:hypothetical protein